jgi:hypothetical protein
MLNTDNFLDLTTRGKTMIRNVITQSKNYFANFDDLPEYSDNHIEEKISVDTEVRMLSSHLTKSKVVS